MRPKHITFVCDHCQTPFVPKDNIRNNRPTPRFCSRLCSGKHNARLEARNCLHCGKPFQPRKDRNRHCSKACAYQARSENALIPFVCAVCGTEKTRKRHETERQYCSFACARKATAKRGDVPCDGCGQVFAQRQPRQRFCSKACRSAFAQSQAEQMRRFILRLPANRTGGCWEWQGNIGAYGYGLFSAYKDGRHYTARAHRFSYEAFVGVIPDNMVVMHTCDNPACVRPDHLQVGTNRENSEDMVQKGRQARGERNAVTRLTAVDVLNIRAKFGTPGVTYRTLATEYSMSIRGIAGILRRETWRHI